MRKGLVILIVALLWGAPAASWGETLGRPLAGSFRVTSTFGEYRSGHYHGGLDFSTGGTTGIPVLAPDSGWLFRVRASGVGYGRAAYLRLDSGQTVVVAHLDRWRRDIDQAVRNRQQELGRYEIDWYPEPDAFRFSAGEVIAYTGASGAGPPHLHVEVRLGVQADIAVNPLQFGWGVPDSVPPSITHLRFEPLRDTARVQGRMGPYTLPLHPDSENRVTTAGPVRIWVSAFDHADNGGRLGLKSLSVSLDGTVVQVVGFQSFDWKAPGEVEWTYHEALAREKNEVWICLDAPSRSPHQIYSGPGLNPPAPGVHLLEISAVDQSGLIAFSTVEWTVNSWKDTEESVPAISPGSFRVTPEAPVRVSIPGLYVDLPRESVYETVYITAALGKGPADPAQETELVPISSVVELEPWALPLRKRVEVGIMLAQHDPKVAIYSKQGDTWSFEGAEPTLGGLRTGVRNLEYLALFRDSTAPRVTLRTPGSSPWPRLRAQIIETGSGVTWRTCRMEVDGGVLVAEWDPESRFLTGYLREALSPGVHHMKVVAQDRSGNREVVERTFHTK